MQDEKGDMITGKEKECKRKTKKSVKNFKLNKQKEFIR